MGDNQYTAQVVRVADRKGRSRGFVISGHRGVIWVGSFFFFFFSTSLSICANGAGGVVGYWDIGLSYDGRDRRR